MAYSTKEQNAITELRSRLKSDAEDHVLAKWLKARSWDVSRAEDMYRASKVFRKTHGVDRLLTSYKVPEVLSRYLPGGFVGEDKEGSPILVDLYPLLDAKGILYSAKKSDIEKTKLLQGEQITRLLDEQSSRLGRRIEGITVIIDMEGAGMSMLWGPGIQMYAQMGKVLQDNYPEVVKRTFIVKAPAVFPLLWKAIKPLVTEEMRQKVSILGHEFQDELLQYIDEDQLPQYLGGSKVDTNGDPRCSEQICQGGVVPESYYRKDTKMRDSMKTVTITSGTHYDITAHVDLPGSILRWEFITDGYDIGFRVTYQYLGGTPSDVIPMNRVNSHLVPEDGTLTCEEPGTYVLRFDNSYSWARGKAVYYNVDLLPPVDMGVVQELDKLTLSHGHVHRGQSTDQNNQQTVDDPALRKALSSEGTEL